MKDAACAGITPTGHVGEDIFFPGRGRSDLRRKAHEVCSKCPVRVQCADYKRRIGAKDGIWGGQD